jgi:hypothetical protein
LHAALVHTRSRALVIAWPKSEARRESRFLKYVIVVVKASIAL